MSKVGRYLSEFISVLVVFGVVFYSGYCFGIKTNELKAEIVEKSETLDFDLKLPGEVEKRVVTKDEVESKIYEIGELSTYCGEYKVSRSEDESRTLLDDRFTIPGTKNTITIECIGNVKFGYDMSEIVVKVGEDTIYVSLPKAYVTNNYLIWDSMECEEKNNILHPIEFSQYEKIIKEIKEEGLADVESKGICDEADENLKKLIKVFLSEFDGYEIEFL